jgi:ABC-type nitrate/sulfonate/bicarbonate transport system permease component
MNGQRSAGVRSRVDGARLVALAGDGAMVVGGLAAALLLWQVVAAAMGRYFPPPLAVFENAYEHFAASRYLRGLGLPQGGYLPHILITLRTVVVGVIMGLVIGAATGMAAWRSKVAGEILDPLTTLFGTVPVLVAAPFFLLWFGLLPATQIILVTFYSFLLLHVFVLGAVRNVDIKYIESARTLGAGDGYIFRKVVLPAALPEIFGGLRIAFASAWGLACIAELLGARYGVGRVIVSLSATNDVVSMMAIIVLVGMLAVIIDGLIVLLRAYLMRWAATAGGR